jgi:transposase
MKQKRAVDNGRNIVETLGGIEQILAENEHLRLELECLKEQLETLKKLLFGKKSEKLYSEISPIQPSLFDEPKTSGLEEQEVLEEKNPSDDNSKKKKKRGRKAISPLFPRRRIVYSKSPEEMNLPCGCRWEAIGEVVTEELEIIPAKIIVNQHVRIQYALRPAPNANFCPIHDSVENDKGCMELVPMPPRIIPQSIVSPSLLAQVVTAKYADSIPLYRQEQQFERIGLDISRATLCNWVLLAAEACSRLLELLFLEIIRGPTVNMDETPLLVLRDTSKSNNTKSFMWVCRGGPLDAPCVLFRYSPTRAASVPQDMLKDFRGFLQTDGYQGYTLIGEQDGIVHVGCWAHVRRKFFDVIKGTKASLRVSIARTVVNQIRELYQIEREAVDKKLTPDQIVEMRMAQSKPILEKIKLLLDEKQPRVPSKCLLGKAIGYALNQWPRLVAFLESGNVKIDNNAVENAIRPFAVGRKNWLFSDSPRGAKAGAALYSLIETARANNIEPNAYLRLIFTELPRATTDDEIRKLLPQQLDRSRLELPQT